MGCSSFSPNSLRNGIELVKSIFVCKFPLGIHTGYAATNAACS